MILRFLPMVLIFVAGNTHADQTFEGHASYVSDGDTLWVQPDTGGPPRKLRLDGIDAPEICQLGGEASRSALSRLALHQYVEVSVRSHDDYGRGLARVRLNGMDLGAEMVRTGHAWSYRWRRSAGLYAAEEAVARRSGLGLFASNQPELPRRFRERHGPCPVPKH